MALNIKDHDADRLARELAAQTGETLTEAIVTALRERLDRESRKRKGPQRLEKLRALRESMRELPIRDGRAPEEIVGYDEKGLLR